MRRRLPRDWTERYNTAPLLIETFVESPRYTGAVYRATNSCQRCHKSIRHVGITDSAFDGELLAAARRFEPVTGPYLLLVARIQPHNGDIRHAELHSYEVHGIGRHEMKRKRQLD